MKHFPLALSTVLAAGNFVKGNRAVAIIVMTIGVVTNIASKRTQ